MFIVLFRDGPHGKWCCTVLLHKTRAAAELWTVNHPYTGRSYSVVYAVMP